MNHRKVPVQRYEKGEIAITSDNLAIETVIRLVCNDINIATLLGSPSDINHLLIGHLLCEGYLGIDSLRGTVNNIESNCDSNGWQLSIELPSNLRMKPKNTGVTTSSCGACNNDGLDQLITELPFATIKPQIDESILFAGFSSMEKMQEGFAKTGGMHSAGLMSIGGELITVSEDIGRHNAVDKVIGKCIDHADFEKTVLLLSGRCGWDIVAKAARAKIPIIASIGACSTLAADCARHLGIRIYSFVRGNTSTIVG